MDTWVFRLRLGIAAAALIAVVAWFVVWHVQHGMWPWWGWPVLGLVVAASAATTFLVIVGLRSEAQTQDLINVLPGAIDLWQAQKDAERLRNGGLDGTATVISASRTGLFFGEEDEVMELTLDVSIEGRPPYSIAHRQPTSPENARKWTPGATVRLKVDPGDPQTLTLLD